MKENLIENENNNENQEKILFKEVKKMSFIKNLNLFVSIFRFFLMFYIVPSDFCREF